MKDCGMTWLWKSMFMVCSAIPFRLAVIGVPVELRVRQIDDDVLDLGIFLVGDEAVLATEVADLEPSPRRCRIDAMMIVAPGVARLQLGRDTMSGRDIAGPDAGRQAELGAAGDGNCLLFGVERDDAD